MGTISEGKKEKKELVDIKKKLIIISIQLYIKGKKKKKNIYIYILVYLYKKFISIHFFLWECCAFNKIYVRRM